MLVEEQLQWWRSTVFIVKFEYIKTGQIYFYALDQARKKTGAQNQSRCAHLIEKQLEAFIFILCKLNRTCSFNLYCNSIKRFCNEVCVVWMLIECLKKNVAKRTILILQAHPSKGFQKNMLKTWSLLNINYPAEALIIICRKTSTQIFLRATPHKYFRYKYVLRLPFRLTTDELMYLN